jgi:hypothetical protein
MLSLFNLQAGQHTLKVTPPTTVAGITVLGSPLTVTVTAGVPEAFYSYALITGPTQPGVGSVVSASIHLRDMYNNAVVVHVTVPAAALSEGYNNSYIYVGEEGAQTTLSYKCYPLLACCCRGSN